MAAPTAVWIRQRACFSLSMKSNLWPRGGTGLQPQVCQRNGQSRSPHGGSPGSQPPSLSLGREGTQSWVDMRTSGAHKAHQGFCRSCIKSLAAVV